MLSVGRDVHPQGRAKHDLAATAVNFDAQGGGSFEEAVGRASGKEIRSSFLDAD